MVDKRVLEFLNSLDIKDQRIIKDKLKILQPNSYPGQDGESEKLHKIRNGSLTASISHVHSQ